MNWESLIPILGSLGGVALGSYGTWRLQRLQIELQNKTRFHQTRMDCYARFLSACTVTLAHQTHPSGEILKQVTEAVQAYDVALLCASEDVRPKLVDLYDEFKKVSESKTHPIPDETLKPYWAARKAFRDAARIELHK